MQKFCLALDLKDDPQLIEEYEEHHQNVWPEIIKSITDSGIISMEIYSVENRLFMMVEANDDFSFELKNQADSKNEKIHEWEELMWKYQLAIPNSEPGEKWRLMERIFDLAKF